MSVIRTLAFAAASAATAALLAAAPASADPGMPDCGQLNFVCSMIPTMPDLDHDIDMTKGQPQNVGRENDQPADVCSVSCI